MVYLLGLYIRLIRIQIRSQLTYRWSFILDVTATALITILNFATLALVFQRFQSIGGWSLGEVAFLYGVVETAFGLMDMLFSGFDPQNFGKYTRLGRFDQMLLRPASITVQVFGSEFILRRLGRIFQGFFVMVIATQMVDLHWTWVKILYLPVVLFSQVLFFGGLFMIGATISFWTVESLEIVNIFTYGGTELISYPMHIYQDWMRRFFTYIIPAIFMNYFPALFFLDKPLPPQVPHVAPFLAPAMGGLIFLLALAFWRFGIQHYQSTGT